MRGMYTENNRTLSQLGAEKIAFPSKPERRKYGHMDRRAVGRSFASKIRFFQVKT